MHEVEPIPVLLLHRHDIVRDALQQRFAASADLVVVASAASPADAVVEFERNPGALVLMDEQPAGPFGIEVMFGLRNVTPECRAVMLVESDDVDVVVAAIRSGVAGIVRSRTPATVLLDALRTVARGACVLDHDALRVLAAAWGDPPRSPLSAREQEVLSCLAEGLTNAETAARLFVSRETVKTHVARLLRKLQVDDRSSAVDRATRLGVLQ